MKRCAVSATTSAVHGDCLITHLKNAVLIVKPSDNLHKYLVHPLTMDEAICHDQVRYNAYMRCTF